MTEKRLLALFAHPDDEAFGSGGTLAAYGAQGVYQALVCTTRGEVGEISDPSLATAETLGAVREGELRCAAQALHIAEVILLDYRDSGMAGTEQNGDHRAYINAPAEEVVSRLVGIMRRVRPQVVLTFEPFGGYGHPDHIAIHTHTVAAFHAAGDPQKYPDQGAPWQPARLFYPLIRRSTFIKMRDRLAQMGIDTSDMNRFDEMPERWPEDKITVLMDVRDTVDNKVAALQCHRTQFGANNLFRRVPEEMMKEIMSQEVFYLAWPETLPGQMLGDLFAGL
ncbi:MAG: GlcNAc-PI de-N-acetylase [Chloroflexi bacterium]|nr:GlcNAc-PI de-N-acetylase [Chloroflexota bacterium]